MNKETIFKTLEYVITSSGSAETYYKIWTANPETPTYAFRTYLSTNEWSFYIDVDNKGSWKINNFSNSGSAVISFAIDANQLFIKTTKHLDLTCRTEVLYGEIVNALPKVDPTAQSKSWNIIANGTTVSQDNTNDLTVLNNANIEKQLNVTGTNSTVNAQAFNVTAANNINTTNFKVSQDANVTGNVNVANNLNITGSTSAVNVINSLNVTGTNSTVKTNSFTVTDANNINTADFNVTKDANITGNTNVTGNATATNLNVTQNANVSNNLNVTGLTSVVNVTKDLNVTGASSSVNINKDLNVKGINAVVNATNLNVANASSINTASLNVSQNASINGNVNITGVDSKLSAQTIEAGNITASKSVNVTNDLSLTGTNSELTINGNLNSKYGNVNVNRINFNNTVQDTNVNVNTQELHYIIATTKTGNLFDISLADDNWNVVTEKIGTFNKAENVFTIKDTEYIYYPKDAQSNGYHHVYYRRYDKAIASSSEEIKEKFNKTALAGKYSPTTNRLIIKGFLTINGDINVDALVINGVTRSSGLATGLDINSEASTLIYQKATKNNKSTTELTELKYKAPVKNVNDIVITSGQLIANDHTIEAKEFIGTLSGNATNATNVALTSEGSGTNKITIHAGSGSTTFTINKVVDAEHAKRADAFNTSTAIGSSSTPIYISNEGKITALTANAGSVIKPIYMENGEFKGFSQQIGDINQPVYVNKEGEITTLTANVGSGIKPIYMENGEFKGFSKQIGDINQPVYVNKEGEITTLTANVGSEDIVYKTGNPTTEIDPLKSTIKPIYLKDGFLTTFKATVGASNKPVYVNAGEITACNSLLDISISGNAATASTANALDSKATIDISQVANLDTALAGKEEKDAAKTAIGLLTSTITGTPAKDSTITDLSQVNGKVTAKFEKISITEDQVSNLSTDLSTINDAINKIKIVDASIGVIGNGIISLNKTLPNETTSTENISVYTLPTASNLAKGGVKVGDGLSIDSTTGVLSTNITYEEIQPKVVK